MFFIPEQKMRKEESMMRVLSNQQEAAIPATNSQEATEKQPRNISDNQEMENKTPKTIETETILSPKPQKVSAPKLFQLPKLSLPKFPHFPKISSIPLTPRMPEFPKLPSFVAPSSRSVN